MTPTANPEPNMYQITFPSKNGVSTFERVGSLRKLGRSDAGAMAKSSWDGSVVYWTGRAWKPLAALTEKQLEAFLGCYCQVIDAWVEGAAPMALNRD